MFTVINCLTEKVIIYIYLIFTYVKYYIFTYFTFFLTGDFCNEYWPDYP